MLRKIFLLTCLALSSSAYATELPNDTHQVLQSYINKKSKGTNFQHFCIVENNANSHWVLWKEEKKAILWHKGEKDLSQSNRQLDLTRDIVANDALVNGSTYKVTKAWVHDLEKHCKTKGKTYKIGE